MNTINSSNEAATSPASNATTPTPTPNPLAASIGAAVAGGGGSAPVTVPVANAMNDKVAINFVTKSSDKALVTESGRIVEMMTGNPVYPAPFPALDVVVAARDAYVSAVNGLDRGSASIALRNQTRTVLRQVLRDLALYVQHASEGDKVKLLSSGFPVQAPRKRGSVGLLAPPEDVRMRRTRSSNQLVALCKAVPGATSYQWRYATAQAPTVWTTPDPVTAARFVLENAVPGTQYIVQVRVLGTSGGSDWSDSATMMAA